MRLAALLCFVISISVQASAKTFDVTTELSFNGKVVSKPHFVTMANEKASIEQTDKENGKIAIEVIASDATQSKSKDAILMKFAVYRDVNGKKTLISSPQIVALPGERAEMTVDQASEPKSIKLSVLAKRL